MKMSYLDLKWKFLLLSAENIDSITKENLHKKYIIKLLFHF